MELALNLACLLIACGSVLAWTLWRRRSDSSLVVPVGQGLLVVGCVLAIVLPAISITDDLAQTPFLAEGMKLKDLLKAPEQLMQPLTAASFIEFFFSQGKAVVSGKVQTHKVRQPFCWSPNLQRRPPPSPTL